MTAWRLIKSCRWRMGTSEKFALLALEQAHIAYDSAWVPASYVAAIWLCSESNAREFLSRPRVAPAVETRRAENKDGKTRTYYRLASDWREFGT